MIHTSRARFALCAFLVFAVFCGVANASTIRFAGVNGNLKASALFADDAQGNFTLSLSNIGTQTAGEAQVLVGLFFKLTDAAGKDITLTPLRATLAPGSTLAQPNGADPTTVGANWAYGSGMKLRSLGYGAANQAVTSAGLGIFGPKNPCFGPCGDVLDGGPWGLVHPDFKDYSGNGGLDGKSPFIRNSVVLTFAKLTGNPTISNVQFQYGTAGGRGMVPGDPVSETPEPSALGLGAIGLALVGVGMLRRRKATARE